MKSISRRQMLALIFVAMLSPFLRLVPREVAAQAGRGAWMSSLVAAVPLALLAAVLARVLKAAPGQGLARAGLRILGPGAGKALLVLWSVWPCFYAGFLLRSGADRFIGTIFPDSTPWMLIAVTAVLVCVAGLGSLKTLARSAEIFRPLLVAVLAVVLLLAAQTARPEFIFPLGREDLLPTAKGSVMVVDTVCIVLVAFAFLAGYEESDTPVLKDHMRFLAGVCVLGSVMCGVVMAVCGPALTAKLSYPFFSMVRDLTVFHTVQRFEAVAVGLWLLPDFVLVTMELFIAADNLTAVFGTAARPEDMSWRDGNRLILLGTAAAVVTAVFIARTEEELALWAFTLIPAINLTLCFGFPLLLFAVGKARKML